MGGSHSVADESYFYRHGIVCLNKELNIHVHVYMYVAVLECARVLYPFHTVHYWMSSICLPPLVCNNYDVNFHSCICVTFKIQSDIYMYSTCTLYMYMYLYIYMYIVHVYVHVHVGHVHVSSTVLCGLFLKVVCHGSVLYCTVNSSLCRHYGSCTCTLGDCFNIQA